MARYDFICPKCTNAVEVTTTMDKIESHKEKCEKCGTDMHRLFQSLDSIIKGTSSKTENGPINLGGGMQLRRK